MPGKVPGMFMAAARGQNSPVVATGNNKKKISHILGNIHAKFHHNLSMGLGLEVPRRSSGTHTYTHTHTQRQIMVHYY